MNATLKVRKGAHLTHYIGPANKTNIETDLKDEWINDELNEDFTSLQNLEHENSGRIVGEIGGYVSKVDSATED